jgi:hypothetical protein
MLSTITQGGCVNSGVFSILTYAAVLLEEKFSGTFSGCGFLPHQLQFISFLSAFQFLLTMSSVAVASYPGRCGGGKTAWYRLFAHARNSPYSVIAACIRGRYAGIRRHGDLQAVPTECATAVVYLRSKG